MQKRLLETLQLQHEWVHRLLQRNGDSRTPVGADTTVVADSSYYSQWSGRDSEVLLYADAAAFRRNQQRINHLSAHYDVNSVKTLGRTDYLCSKRGGGLSYF